MSKSYKANKEKVENKMYSVKEAVALLADMKMPKFKNGVSVELHFKLNINPTKSDQLVRSSTTLPNGTGKTLKIAAFVTADTEADAKEAGADVIGGENLIEEIKKTGKIDFDAAVAEPAMMKKLGPIARILGTAGVMPSPKNQTVGTDMKEMILPLKKGKIEIKNDKTGNVHLLVGKFEKMNQEQIVENIEHAIEAVEKAKPEVVKKKYIESIHVATTMSPSVKISTNAEEK